MKKIKRIIVLFVVSMFCFICFLGCNIKRKNDLKQIDVSNFDFSIVTNKNVYAVDDEIQIDITLTNWSSYDIEIAYFFLITPIIPTATNYPSVTEMPEEPYLKQFNENDRIILKDDLGGYFDLGIHEVKYKALFYINWGKENEQTIEILSNTIQIEIAE